MRRTFGSTRLQRAAARAALLSTALLATLALARPALERAVRTRLEQEAARRGLAVAVDDVRVGLWPVLRLTNVHLSRPGAALSTNGVGVYPRPGWLRVSIGPVDMAGPGGLGVQVAASDWTLSRASPRWFRAELEAPARGLVAVLSEGGAGGGGSRIEVHATDLPLGLMAKVQRAGAPILDPGTVAGELRLGLEPEANTFDLDAALAEARLASLGNEGAEASQAASAFGLPTSVTLRLAGAWRPSEARLAIPNWRVTVEGAAASGALVVSEVGKDARVEMSLAVERVDFAKLLGTSGLSQPAVVGAAAGAPEVDLGSASLSAKIEGRLADPRSFTVAQKLDFTPPRRALPALEALRGPFVHEVSLRGGGRRAIDVSPASDDFVAYADVPPLFVRTLLLGEDSGFFGHRGIDLSELPSALLTNWARGDAARGASTITQQLAKNLFLSREKKLGRKLQELSLALLLEATLGKERLLEIYLNVIEWGPDLYGLRPACRRYFGREPAELTPRQMAFLVALIPGPVKYQRSFADGTVSAGFRPLVDALLAKLRSIDGLSVEEYEAALTEELQIGAPGGGPDEALVGGV